ncbi:MAG TPA: alpha/beta hydrolase [Bauldia sp.]|nr:alpha/beta hydrolase [Bauldia sp.]
MDLFGIESNPVPDGAVVGYILTSDGVRLRTAHWRPTARRTLGTVCILQGRAESIERYFETVGDLRRRGFAVATLDWRGQGGSERRLRNPRKGHIDSFNEYDRDLDAFMQQVALPDCPPPHFALAHSTGGLVCLRAVRDGRARFTRIVTDGPLIQLGNRRPSQGVVTAATAMMTALGFGELEVPGRYSVTIERMKFENNPLTSDPVRFERNREIALKAPQVTVGLPTYGWVYAACRAMAEAAEESFPAAINTPVLLVAGSLDRIVSVTAIESLAGELRAGSFLLLPGARHEVLNERDKLREQFWAAFDAFIPGS